MWLFIFLALLCTCLSVVSQTLCTLIVYLYAGAAQMKHYTKSLVIVEKTNLYGCMKIISYKVLILRLPLDISLRHSWMLTLLIQNTVLGVPPFPPQVFGTLDGLNKHNSVSCLGLVLLLNFYQSNQDLNIMLILDTRVSQMWRFLVIRGKN